MIRSDCEVKAFSTAFSTTAFKPSAVVDVVSTTAQPSVADNFSTSIFVPFFG